jgi:hypothetical protein
MAAMARALWWIGRGRSIAPLPERSENCAAITSIAMAVVVSAVLLFVPVYTEETITGETSSERTFINEPVRHHLTLLQVNHASALVALEVPTLIACLPLLFRRSRWRALVEASTATLLTAFSLIPFTIGFFYLPSAVAMLVAALLARPARASAIIS